MSNIWDFDGILKIECKQQHFTRNCRIKNLDDFERHEVDAYLWRAGILKVKEKEQVSGNAFERRAGKCCVVLMKHRRKVKGKQVITPQMAQQLKNTVLSSV